MRLSGDGLGVLADIADAAVGAGGDEVKASGAFVDQGGVVGQPVVRPAVFCQALADGRAGFKGKHAGDLAEEGEVRAQLDRLSR